MFSALLLHILFSAQQVEYSRDIRPILSSSCFTCHGRDPSSREEELRLDEFEFATAEREQGFAIVPGDPENSLLWQRISTNDLDDIMPPLDSKVHDQLTKSQRKLIYDWIKQGAKYEKHWAFVPPSKVVIGGNENAIDFFIGEVSERADDATLLRRLFLDVTGLPPTLEEYELFSDLSQSERVDKLFSTPIYLQRYAERMATPWLDAARYGDTIGTHTDAGRQMWKWRDWVLDAYQNNMPFDQFTYEQLAGDLIEDATIQQQVASGFNRNHVITDEGGAIDEEYLVEYAADRVNTTGEMFLGLTMGCARCHDHKFNPITQDDYFSMFAYFNSIDEPGLYTQEANNPTRAFEPMLAVPNAMQQKNIEELGVDIAAIKAMLNAPSEKDAAEFSKFISNAKRDYQIEWQDSVVTSATSSSDSELAIHDKNAVTVSGPSPATDDHLITLRIDDDAARLLLFEFSNGRASNGNVVLSEISAECISLKDPSQSQLIHFNWAYADHTQTNSDWNAVNVFDGGNKLGWAPAAHQVSGGRNLLLLADSDFGFLGGCEVNIKLSYQSVHAEHVYGDIKISSAAVSAATLDALPLATSRWYGTWPYTPKDRYSGYDEIFGPEADVQIDFDKKYEPDQYSWVLVEGVKDDELFNGLPAGEKISFAGKRIFAPSARELEVSIGSDDGVQLFLNGEMIFENRIDRGAAADQDKATLSLVKGLNTVVMKIINTGGTGGMYWSQRPPLDELSQSLVWSLAPENVLDDGVDGLRDKLSNDWRLLHSPEYREQTQTLAARNGDLTALEASIPKTMVMRELDEPRQTYVLMRGEYDKADKERPVERGVPFELGSLAADAPNDRRGLAQWLISNDNPLTARVYVNRLWQMIFGTGIVATPNDFGLQGAWPANRELLDWLAVEFIESGWDVQHILTLIYSSEVYQQSSKIKNSDKQWLSYFPRRRLGAEEIRDQALHLSGLLVERVGGVSVKPYQPEGLWKEVAMPQSNTSIFTRGDGDDLYRRSLYTYWKRSSPPPSLLTFDAPTREFCTISRGTTNTPLQALVLWNDVQFLEAARILAQNILLLDAPKVTGVHHWRLTQMFKTCTGRTPSADETGLLYDVLGQMQAKFDSAPEDADNLLAYGEAAIDETLAPTTLAAYTMMANAILSLDEVINQN